MLFCHCERYAGVTAQPRLGYGRQESCQAHVCAKLPPHSPGQNQLGPPLYPALALHRGKSRNTNKTRKVLHSTGSLLWTVEGAGNVQNVPAVLLAPGRDMWDQFSARCGIAGKGWHVAVHVACCCACCMLLCMLQVAVFLLPSRVSALTQAGCSQQHDPLPESACCVTPSCLHFHALLLHSTDRESCLLKQQSVQSYQKDPKQKPPWTTTENSGCTKQVFTVNSVVWIT